MIQNRLCMKLIISKPLFITVIKDIVIYGGIDTRMFVKLTIKSNTLEEFCNNANINMLKISKKIEGKISNWWEMEAKEFDFYYEDNHKYFVFSKPKDGIITILMSDSYT